MMKLSLVSASGGVSDIVKKLTWLKCVQIVRTENGTDDVPPDESIELERARRTREADSIAAALAGLRRYRTDKTGLFGSPSVITRDRLDTESEEYISAAALAAEYESVSQRSAEITAELTRLKQQRESLAPWTGCDVPLDVLGTAMTDLTFGVLPPQTDVAAVNAEIRGEDGEFELLSVSGDPSGEYVAAVTMKDGGQDELDALTRRGFTRVDFRPLCLTGESNLAGDIVSRISAEEEKLTAEMNGIADKYAAMASGCRELEIAYDAAMTRAAQCEREKMICRTERTSVVTAWVPYLAVPAVKSELDGDPAIWYELSDPAEGEEAPVLLLNKPLFAPFESVIGLYSLPAYGSFDPTVIMSIFFFVIFGLMLGDFVYGTAMTVLCALALKKLNLSPGLRNLVKLFCICGVSSAVWGMLFGSYFGDLPQQFMRNFFGVEIGGTALWFDIVSEPLMFLGVSLGVGVLHLFAGMGVKIYIAAKEGRALDGVLDVVPWYVFFAGIGLFAAAGVLGIPADIGKWVLIAGVALLILTQGRKEKNPVMKILKGVMSLYDTVSYVSDLLSYSRIMALGLASAVIAQVVNIFATMGGNSVIGWIMLILIVPLGHVINLVINLLGTFVHDARLQYIEFFGKFYEDGGKPFTPAAPVTKYTVIRE